MSFQSERLVIGHRGAAGLAPENTLAGFARAAALGVHGVELDVHCVDGRLLVIHDDRLDRTTSGSGDIHSFCIERLRALDAGDGQPIPFMEEVFDALPPEVGINVEMKGPKTAAPVSSVLREFGNRQRDVLVSAFNLDELRRFAERARGDVPLAPLFQRWHAGIPEVASELRAWSVNLGIRAATQQHIEALRSRGFRVLVHTVNRPVDAERLFSWGATGIFTDFPDRMIPAVASARD